METKFVKVSEKKIDRSVTDLTKFENRLIEEIAKQKSKESSQYAEILASTYLFPEEQRVEVDFNFEPYAGSFKSKGKEQRGEILKLAVKHADDCLNENRVDLKVRMIKDNVLMEVYDYKRQPTKVVIENTLSASFDPILDKLKKKAKDLTGD